MWGRRKALKERRLAAERNTEREGVFASGMNGSGI
jgi:hypothetical protein